jgi:hypothetical protein
MLEVICWFEPPTTSPRHKIYPKPNNDRGNGSWKQAAADIYLESPKLVCYIMNPTELCAVPLQSTW